MAARDAVRSTAVARREVRNSLARLEYHLGRGLKGRKGVQREIRFLDSLHRQTVRVNGLAVGRAYTGRGLDPFGQKAARALATGNSAVIGRAKSSLLADFSANGLQPVRDIAPQMGLWVWTANASACPSCLERHGDKRTGPFVPLHPSCLCVPSDPTSGVRTLSDDELVSTWDKYGDPRYRSQMEAFRAGEQGRDALRGIEAVNRTARGARAVEEHLLKGEARQTALPGAEGPKQTPIEALRAERAAGSKQYLEDYAAAPEDEKTRVLDAWKAREKSLNDRIRELEAEQRKADGLSRVGRVSDTPVATPERTWLRDLERDFVPHTRAVKSPAKFKGYGDRVERLEMSEAGIKQRARSIAKQFADDMDMEEIRDIRIFLDHEEWNAAAARHPGAGAFVEGQTVYLGPEVSRTLGYVSDGWGQPSAFRVLAHELSHTASTAKAKGYLNTGLRPYFEEAGSEINAHVWVQRRFADDAFGIEQSIIRTGRGSVRVPARDYSYYQVSYADRVEEIILQAARRNGWNREAMLDDILYQFHKGDDLTDFFYAEDGQVVRIFDRLYSRGDDALAKDEVAGAWHKAILDDAPPEATRFFDDALGGPGWSDGLSTAKEFGEVVSEKEYAEVQARVGSLLKWLVEGPA